jgi:hypothetical protein
VKQQETGVCAVQRRDSYGTVRVYPVNATAELFTRLTGRKTLSPADLGLIELLGYEVEWVPQDIPTNTYARASIRGTDLKKIEED